MDDPIVEGLIGGRGVDGGGGEYSVSNFCSPVAVGARELALRAELLTAGAFISIIVPMIVFFTLQRFMIRGMTSGAVKG